MSIFRRVLAGQSAQVFGDPAQLHSYSFTPDVARGLVALGSRADMQGVWMLPVQPAESTRAVVARCAAALGRPISLQAIPTWLLRTVGVFQPMTRELADMVYQWKQPYVVDDAKFRRTFAVEPTGWDEADAQTVSWARATWGSALVRPKPARKSSFSLKRGRSSASRSELSAKGKASGCSAGESPS